VAFDIGYIEESDFHRLLAQAEEVGRGRGWSSSLCREARE
jgi:hypothetical protein